MGVVAIAFWISVSTRALFFTLPWRGRVGARRAPGWGDSTDASCACVALVFKSTWFSFARAIKRDVDRVHHSMNILADLVVPKAEDSVALGLKPFCTQLVAPASFTFAMLRPVDLNDETRRRTGKIDNEFSDRHLPAKVSATRRETF